MDRLSQDSSGSRRGIPEIRLILVGNIGCGKTSTANTLLNESPNPIPALPSRENEVRHGVSEGRHLTIVETPRWYWNGKHIDSSVQSETGMALSLVAPGPHAFLILVPVGQCTGMDSQIPTELERVFGRGALEHSMVVLTCGDYLAGRDHDRYIRMDERELGTLVNECGGRWHVLNNRRLDDRQQVISLLEKVEQLTERTGGCYLPSAMHRAAQEQLREKEHELQRRYSLQERELVHPDRSTLTQTTWSKEETWDASERRGKIRVRSMGPATGRMFSQQLANGLQSQTSYEDPPVGLDQRRSSFKLSKEGAILSHMSETEQQARNLNNQNFINSIHYQISTMGDTSSTAPSLPSPTATIAPYSPSSNAFSSLSSSTSTTFSPSSSTNFSYSSTTRLSSPTNASTSPSSNALSSSSSTNLSSYSSTTFPSSPTNASLSPSSNALSSSSSTNFSSYSSTTFPSSPTNASTSPSSNALSSSSSTNLSSYSSTTFPSSPTNASLSPSSNALSSSSSTNFSLYSSNKLPSSPNNTSFSTSSTALSSSDTLSSSSPRSSASFLSSSTAFSSSSPNTSAYFSSSSTDVSSSSSSRTNASFLSSSTVLSSHPSPASSSSSSSRSSASDDLRLVLLGRTGSGKSAAGNAILGRDEFKLRKDNATGATTQSCVKGTAVIGQKQVAVVDTPDWFWPSCPPEKLATHLSSCMDLCAPGPHAFLLCVPVTLPGRSNLHDLDFIKNSFGPNATEKRTLVLFTHSDMLKDENVDAYISAKRPELQTLVERCGDHYHVLKQGGNEKNIEEILEKVEQLVKESGGNHYSYQEKREFGKEMTMQSRRGRGGEDNVDRALSATLHSLREEEEVEQEEKNAKPVESMASSATSMLNSVLRFVGQKVGEGAKQVPKLVAGGAVLGGVLGLYVGGPVGGAVGATAGTVAAEYGRRKYSKPKTD